MEYVIKRKLTAAQYRKMKLADEISLEITVEDDYAKIVQKFKIK